ncbi:hypothetical protein TUM20286_36450 [Pseudomonas tohonis]|uniref:Uncharacterized protein n=1 Tax=Pseudomonas tohonis TaxID=2725477 RepID=A0ABQ4W365_9PSED|nr:hypothetical protein TUM20286_36450 [Pseudomonas tohonis]
MIQCAMSVTSALAGVSLLTGASDDEFTAKRLADLNFPPAASLELPLAPPLRCTLGAIHVAFATGGLVQG